MGDLVDNRKTINYQTLREMRSCFLEGIDRLNLELDIIVGNHDAYYKNTNRINSVDELLGERKNIRIYSGPKEIELGGCKTLFLPWICAENYEESKQLRDKTNASIVFGHLELSDFEMHKGYYQTGGDDPGLYSKFTRVFSGHYHHPSSRDNVFYLGAPYELTWADFCDPRGFHFFDTQTFKLDFVRNPLEMHRKVFYDDRNKKLREITPPPSDLLDCIVKVVIKGRTKPLWFDRFIEAIEEQGPSLLLTVDDHHHADKLPDSDIMEGVEDTLSAIRTYIKHMVDDESQDEIGSYVEELYREAIAVSQVSD